MVSTKGASPPTDPIHRTATVANPTGTHDGGASHRRDDRPDDAAGAVDTGGTIDNSICVRRLESQGRDERGAGESREYEQAHSHLLCLGSKLISSPVSDML
jgi:hypothetical protein